MKEILIKFLEWMNEVSRKQPMRLETDFDDIIMMFMEECKLEESHISEVVLSVSDFALKISTVLLESQSSTAVFFVQQAYPDDIDGLEQTNFRDLLITVKNNAEQILSKH